jgi:Cu2+-exporting ATPase
MSRALVAAHPPRSAHAWRDVVEVPGCGIEAFDAQGGRWRLGSARWVGADAGDIAALCLAAPHGAVLGFDHDESLAEGAAEGVQALRAAGLQITLLSGDAPGRVRRLAERLGIEQQVAAATPEGKAEAVRAEQARGRVVLMAGDGVNDAPVLAQADVSFALAHGAQIAHSAADAVLLSGRIGDVAEAVRAARRCLRVTRQNLLWAALYNAACVPLALLGWLPPWAAGLGMATSSAFVVLNALRLTKP